MVHAVLLCFPPSQKPSMMVTLPPGLASPPNYFKNTFPKQPHTILGHMDQIRQNTRSTSTNITTEQDLDPFFDIINPDPQEATHNIMTFIFEPTNQIFSDLTGRFPVKSSSGNQYIFLLYNYDSNTIHTRPLRSRKGSAIVEAFKSIYDMLVSRGLKPKLMKLDNEASFELQRMLTKNKVDFQLVPPHVHRRNAAERCIRTFKNHFITTIEATHPDFLLTEWDSLLPQSEMTLNMLRPSRFNPKMSGYTQVNGEFNFNRTPLLRRVPKQ